MENQRSKGCSSPHSIKQCLPEKDIQMALFVQQHLGTLEESGWNVLRCSGGGISSLP